MLFRSSRYNMTGGTVEAVPTVGSFAVGLSNPSVKTGINVKIEISAVVAKSTPIYNVVAANFPTADKSEMWQTAEREVLFQRIKTRFDGRDDPSVSTACFCVLQKLIRNFTPDELRQRAASEQEILLSRMQKDCFSESNNVQLAIDMDNLTANKHDVDSLEKVGNLPKLLDLSRKIAATYPSVSNRSRLVRSLILTQQFAEAHPLAENLAVQNLTDLPIQLNWAHVQLFENQLDKAEQQYVKFRNQRNTEGVTGEQMVAADFKLFVRNKIFNSRYDNILKKLKIKN